MKTLLQHIRLYFHEVDKKVLAASTLFTACLVILNYSAGLNEKINGGGFYFLRLLGSYAIFLLAFMIPYLFYRIAGLKEPWKDRSFLLLLMLAPLIFAFKHSFVLPFSMGGNTNWQLYWDHIFYWPLLVILVSGILYLLWKSYKHPGDFYGTRARDLDLKPYLLMLLFMLPLVAAASTQPDFISMYPKLKVIGEVYHEPGFSPAHKFLFEIAYGSDFITIELFFRGFLVLAFTKWAGKEVILPMACFYCTIHFGKPLGECISSYFGGLLLGIIVYHTRSILGGLIVHLGIAWMMEAGGYLGGLMQE